MAPAPQGVGVFFCFSQILSQNRYNKIYIQWQWLLFETIVLLKFAL
jgi:hypothetical protein